MEKQYGSANAGDYDVVRSTQFEEDVARGVRVSPAQPYNLLHDQVAKFAYSRFHLLSFVHICQTTLEDSYAV